MTRPTGVLSVAAFWEEVSNDRCGDRRHGALHAADSLSNAELVETFNAYVERFNAANAEAIAAGEVQALTPSSAEFIEKASGIKSRFVVDKTGLVDPERMAPNIPERSNDEISVLAEIAVEAARDAIARWGKDASRDRRGDLRRLQHAARLSGHGHRGAAGAGHRRLRLRHERGLLLGHLRHQDRRRLRGLGLGAGGADGQSGDLLGPPELPRPRQPLHLRRRGHRRDRGARRTQATGGWDILGTRLKTQFSNNIRNNFGFLNRAAPEGIGADDKLFVQEGRKVFREVVPMVSEMIVEHADDLGLDPHGLKRLWLHQANINMNDMIGKRVLGREPDRGENVIILDEYANTSSAGSIIAFHKANDDFAAGETGLICSFGAGLFGGHGVRQKAVNAPHQIALGPKDRSQIGGRPQHDQCAEIHVDVQVCRRGVRGDLLLQLSRRCRSNDVQGLHGGQGAWTWPGPTKICEEAQGSAIRKQLRAHSSDVCR